jgi:4-oxalocrotonate tautomerase
MPYLNLKIAGANEPRAIAELAGQLTMLTTEVLSKRREATAVAVELVPAGHWFVAGRPLAAGRRAFFLEVKVTEGTNTKDEKAAFLKGTHAAAEAVLGPVDPASYIVSSSTRCARMRGAMRALRRSAAISRERRPPKDSTRGYQRLTEQVSGRRRACPAARMNKETIMQLGLAQANFALEARTLMSLTDAAGAEVAVLKGQVWLTTDGDLRDIFLAPGEVHAIERGGLTLINAVEPSVLHVQPPRPARPWWKRWLMNVWDALAAAGEARARARMKRGIYRF